MKEHVTREVFQAGGGGFTSMEDAAVYLIHAEGHAALVDAGCGRSSARLLNNIRSYGVQPEELEYLLLTHCHYDHAGGAEAIRSASGCRIVAHEIEARYLEAGDDQVTAAGWYGASMAPLRVDRKLTGSRETVMLGQRPIDSIHVPGHSPGSVVYLMESEGMKVLFGQDVHGPLDPSLLSNAAEYRDSLELMASMEADILCEGHYGVFRGREEVKRFIRSFL